VPRISARRLAGGWTVAALLLAACGGPVKPSMSSLCGPYPDQATSPYVLPYPVGATHTVYQGNCGTISHLGGTQWKYAYDFYASIGDPVVAVADGRVVRIVKSFPNTTLIPEEENYVLIDHGIYPDGNRRWSHYSHLDQNGVFVEAGDEVKQGQIIGRTGSSGTTLPHLHFQVYLASEMTVAVTFRNTRPHPDGLVEGEAYTALPY